MDIHSGRPDTQRSTWLLWGASLTATVGGFLFGFDTAVISGTITFVKSQFNLSALAEGWFVSSALVGCIVGVAFAGMLSDRFGRNKILLLSSALFLVSTMGCTFAPSHVALIVSRLVAGMAIGVASMLAPLYISEIAPPSIRGRLVSLYQFAITVGILCAYFSNAWILSLSQGAGHADGMLSWVHDREAWRGMFGAMIIPDIAFMVLLLFAPESPRWLISKGLTEKAKLVLARIQGVENIGREYEQIAGTIGGEQVSMAQLLSPSMRVPLLIGILLPVFSQLSGINAIIYYGPEILNKAGLSVSDALGGQVLIGIVNVLFTLLAIWQVDKLGRKPLLLFGISGTCISLSAVGLFFRLQIANSAVLIVCIMFFIACFAFSYGPVTWIVISEIFPTRIRGRAMSIGVLALWGTNAIIGQVFPWMLEHSGPGGTFWVFAALCVPALLLVWKLLPETKGKSLEEIEHQLHTVAD